MSLKSSLPPKLDIDEIIAAGELAIAQESAAIAIADDHNSFALTLHAALTRHQGNLLWSPLSVRTALAMTYAGARGETANEFQAVLRASKSGERFHEDWSATIGRLASTSDTTYELAVANSLWTQADAPIL